jgi:hypothetical protein
MKDHETSFLQEKDFELPAGPGKLRAERRPSSLGEEVSGGFL